MPAAIPLIGAAFSVSAGLEIGGLIGGLMVAGGGLTAVGTLTGNKDLTNLGAVLGLAGGIGNLAGLGSSSLSASAPLSEMDSVYQGAADVGASTTANVGGTVTQGAQDVTSAALSTANEAGNSLSGLGNNAPTGLLQDAMNNGPTAYASPSSDTGLNMQPRADAATSAASPTRALNSAGPRGNDVANAINQPGPAQMPTPENPVGQYGLANAPSNGPTAYTSPSSDTGINAVADGGGTTQAMQGGFGAGKSGDAAAGWWPQAKEMAEKFAKFTKEYPELTNNAAGLIKGAFGYYGDQQKAEDDQQRKMAYQDWQRQRYSDSVRNLRVPGLVRTTPQTGGIIAGARG